MSVIVDGMKMPENCESCPCSRDMSAYMDVAEGVAVGCKIRMLISRTGRGTRPAWCPLRPAPEWISVDQHGPVDSGWYWAWIVEPGYDEGEMVPSYYYARYDEWQSIECGIACSLPNHSILRIMPMQFPEPPTEKEPDQ